MPEKTVIQLAVYRQVYWNKFFEGTKAGCPKILGQVFSLHMLGNCIRQELQDDAFIQRK